MTYSVGERVAIKKEGSGGKELRERKGNERVRGRDGGREGERVRGREGERARG